VTFGDVAADGSHTFPTAAQLAAIDPDTLNAQVRSGYRIKSLHLFAQSVADGSIDIESWRTNPPDAETVYKM
jgi:3-methyladenine DNA glycosylase/8-oxoguanine DNA glycosylase